MWSIVLRYILKHIRYWVKKKKRSVETTAVNNGQKKKLALKSQERCRRTWQTLMVQTQLKTRPRRTLLKFNSKEMKWTPGHIFMLYYAVVDKVHRSNTWVKVQIRIIQYYSSKSKSTAFSILLEWKYKSTQFFMYLSKKVLIDRLILQFYIDYFI